jgi:hypothetical protein
MMYARCRSSAAAFEVALMRWNTSFPMSTRGNVGGRVLIGKGIPPRKAVLGGGVIEERHLGATSMDKLAAKRGGGSEALTGTEGRQAVCLKDGRVRQPVSGHKRAVSSSSSSRLAFAGGAGNSLRLTLGILY